MPAQLIQYSFTRMEVTDEEERRLEEVPKAQQADREGSQCQ
jgi:hypothetical protein